MHQHRRRKKRPSYGVRTVEISRSKNGFGFTISGQAPCILSCIISGSPAEKAGLRPGDFLIAVNGQNVSKVPHDDVVRLIGNSSGLLKLQIAENYYSDSSEEEFVSAVKLKPHTKYPNKIRNRHQNSVSRAEKVVQDLQTGALFVDHVHGSNTSVPQKQNTKIHPINTSNPSRSNKVLFDLILQQRLRSTNNKHSLPNTSSAKVTPVSTKGKTKTSSKKKDGKSLKSRSHPEHLNTSSSSASEVFHSIFTEQDLNNILYPAILASREIKGIQEEAVLKAVVGYLGTIEMPKEHQLPNSCLQTIRNCIRRLRIEQKVHTLVLLSVFTESIILINPQGVTLAEFSADKITFSGVYSDDKKFFGLVITNNGSHNEELCENISDDPGSVSSSCHVFMVDPKLSPHHQHLKRAKAFHITCSLDPVTNMCKEFPESADSILQAVVGLYRSKLGLNEVIHGLDFNVNMSPQPSNTSSNSSNSDSGIGFRDEGNASDRVFVVDVDYQYSTNSLDRQAFSNPNLSLLESPLRTFSLTQDNPALMSKSLTHSNESKSHSNKKSPCHFDRLTVRAMPDPVGFERSCVFKPDSTDLCTSMSNRNTLHNHKSSREDECSNSLNNGNNVNQMGACLEENMVDNQNASSEDSHSNKLSPKVYDLNYSLKAGEEMGFCNTSVESTGWECTSCSTEELQMNPYSPFLMLQETQDATEKEEDGSQDVHPPTQEEDSESEIFGIEQGNDSSRKCGRTSSLRRYLERKSLHRSTHEAGTVSDGELASGKVSTSSSILALDRMSDTSHRSSSISERPIDVGRVGSWASGFSVLLEDPAGLHTFSEFLKKEFSEENITFWILCEQYRQLKDKSSMTVMAKEIYNKHLCMGAHEPVNVDSHARQVAQEGLEAPTPDLFLPAQKQIFNLMKFDCYQRFLKSSMFKECMLREMQGKPLLYQGQSHREPFEDNKHAHHKEHAEMKKRNYLIPWLKLSKAKSTESKKGGSRIWDKHCEIRKSLKKKKDKDSNKIDDTSSTQSDITGSRSSLTSSETGMGIMYKNISRESLNSAELTLFPNHCGTDSYYCRVILPDLSTTVVRTQKGETVGEMLLKLLERKGLTYNAVEAYLVGSHQPLDHCTDVTSLSCKEIRVEQVILFCVELPNKKTIGVKAKNHKICGDILKPVLLKYGYKMDCVTMKVASTKKSVPKHAPITAIDNERILVEVKDIFSCATDLEELTNQIFDDLLKTRPEFQYDGLRHSDHKRNSNSAKNVPSKSPNYLHQTFSPNDMDLLQSTGKSGHVTKAESIKFLSENKPLLPLNPLRCSSTYDVTDSSLTSCVTDMHSSTKFDSNSNEFFHGKENFPLSNKSDGKTNALFNDIDVDCGLAAAFQNINSNFSHDLMFSATKLAERYFPTAGYASMDIEETSSKKFLQNLGIIPSDMDNLNTRPSQWSGSKAHPISHLPPRLPPRVRVSEQKETIAIDSSPTPNMDSTLTANDSFELDLDVDVTLHAQSDESVSPPVSFSSELKDQTDNSPIENELAKDITFSQPLLRRLSCDPPPVPPKALARGPPPRPPSRQLAHNNSGFCLISEEDVSEDDDHLVNSMKSDLISIQKSSYLNLDKDYGDFNISFV